ncbi:hypothetical protein BU17DRAFT_37958 [Hysterangium stoloniferum]|nr:hypothetical protein BU17DRAFT_37958 [Hysterangium stoloniferum]
MDSDQETKPGLQPDIKQSTSFCSPDADFLIHSSDGYALRIHSRILIEGSTVFKDMMTVAAAPVDEKGELPPLLLEETANILDLGFQFLYPIPDPAITSFDTLKELLRLADKYNLEGVMHTLRSILISPIFLERSSLRSYAIACLYNFEAERKLASRHCLKTDVIMEAEISDELAMMTGKDLLRLIKLQQTRTTAIVNFMATTAPSPCAGPGATAGVPLWWIEFKSRAKEEIRTRPLADTIFQAKFLAQCVNAGVANGCAQCPANYLSSATQARLEQMKAMVDALPDTV